MAIDYKAALLYPYQGKNMENALLFPGLVTYVYYIAVMLVILLILLFLWLVVGQDVESLKHGVDGLNVPFNILLSAVFQGFQWHFYGRFQQQGLAADPPSWMEHWKSFFIDGLKVTVFHIMLTVLLVLVLGLISLGLFLGLGFSSMPDETKLMLGIAFVVVGLVLWFFTTPFWLAPLAQSANTRKFSDLCNIRAAIQLARARYWDVISAMFFILLTGILYLLGSLLLTITCIGILLLPFVWAGGLNTTVYHLIAQGFGLHQGDLKSSHPPIIAPA